MFPSSEALSQLLGTLYDAASDPASWQEFLRLLGEETDASSAGFLMYDVAQSSYKLSAHWQVDPIAQTEYEQHYGQLDIWAQRGLAKPAGFVCISETLARPSEMKKTEIYNDFMVRFGIEHGMFAAVENTGSRITSVSLYRTSSRPQFHESDMELLRFLLPHIDRAVRLHARFSELRDHSAGIVAALDLLASGLILLGAKGQVVLMNRRASEIAIERDGLLATVAGLRAERHSESDLMARAIQQAVHGANGPVGGTVLVSRRARPPLQVLISPVRYSSASFPFAPQPICAVAFVTDPSQRQRLPQEILRVLFRLTPAECRVALLLGDGHASKEVANMVGVTKNTVRSQIKSIFSKTGVKRQSELMRLLLCYSGAAIQGTSASAG